jgi:dihydroxyacetone kinase
MMTIRAEDIRSWFRELARALEEEQDLLDGLDAGAGDGDHGATMVLGIRRVLKTIDNPADTTPGTVLKTAGRSFAGVGGSIGPLWGMALLRAGQVAGAADLIDGATLAVIASSAGDAMTDIGSARPGDRTLLDAAIPAAQAFSETQARTGNPVEAARAAHQAALAGARATASMTPRRGRASRNASLARGRVDPGAASVALAWTVAVAPEQRQAWRHVAIAGPEPVLGEMP